MREAVTVGTLIAFVQYVRMFFEPVRNLSDQLNSIQAAFAASERVFSLLDDDQSLPEAAQPARLAGGRARGADRLRGRVVRLRAPAGAGDRK